MTGARPTIDLDGSWDFVADPEGSLGPDALPAGEPITVPGCWEAQISNPQGIVRAWYQRRFTLPSDWTDDVLLLHFGAVMYSCRAWLNGRSIGAHEGGWTAFSLRADEAARYGAENELVVEVINPLNALTEFPAFNVAEQVASMDAAVAGLPGGEIPHGKQTWYASTSGLWQSVRAERVAPRHLAWLEARPDLAAGGVRLHWGLAGAGTPLEVEATALAPDGSSVPGVRGPADAGELLLPVGSPVLWDIGAPHLYEVRLALRADGVAVDQLQTRIGMRQVTTREGVVELNGRPIYLAGALDQDFYPESIGTPPSRTYLAEQFRRVREMGLNLVRCHIKVPDPAYLDAADEAGVLVWAELPSWTRFSPDAASRARETLDEMVRTLGDHPSLIIWTVVNEDWGTRLRSEARDRRWLRETASWLRQRDPGRLVVDNSACDTATKPNFHLETDLADYHAYRAIPDQAASWRVLVAELAARPAWLWSPHGDASVRGDEPLLMSEFGAWGLPSVGKGAAEAWWFSTGRDEYLPAGIAARFVEQRLERLWPDLDALAVATQWHQFEALQYEIGQLRRWPQIGGHVITELTDAYWEANGLLDLDRRPKAYHQRLAELNADEVLVVEPERYDVWGGGELSLRVTLASVGHTHAPRSLRWELRLNDEAAASGDAPVNGGLATPSIRIPSVETATAATLSVALEGGQPRAEVRLAVLPHRSIAEPPRNVGVHDPAGLWGLADRLEARGHRLVGAEFAEVLVASQLTPELLEAAGIGGRVLLLARSRNTIAPGVALPRPIRVVARWLPADDSNGYQNPWRGDWITAFSWLLPGSLPNVPEHNPLDLSFAEVMPDHVLAGYDPALHADEVFAGMFVGWVHSPAALAWDVPVGRGMICVTTLHVAPENGPMATTLMDDLLGHVMEHPSAVAPRLAVAG